MDCEKYVSAITDRVVLTKPVSESLIYHVIITLLHVE